MGDERKRTSLHNKLKAYLNTVNDHHRTPLTYTSAEETMTRIEEVWADFKVVQSKLEQTAADDIAFAVQETAGEQVEKTFSEARGKLRTIVKVLAAAFATRSGSTSTTTSTSSSDSLAKLPKFEIKPFEGKYDSWMSFRDLFSSSIVNRATATGSQKLVYLKSYLRGEPLKLIDYLTTTDANFTEAWRILNDRYHNEREIVRAHTYNLLDLKPVKGESASHLQTLVDECNNCLNSLKVLKRPTDHWDDLVIAIMEKKIDSETRREWAKKHPGTSPPKFEDFMKFLDSHIRGLQAAGITGSSHTSERRGDKQIRVHHATSVGGKCLICSNSHKIWECNEFLSTSPAERSTMVRKAKLCFNCLKGDHMIKACPSTRKCKKCGSRHHTFLHEERSSNQVVELEKAVTSNHVAAAVDSRGICMTVMVHVIDKFGTRQPCRAFVDPGATADFISEGCVNRLGLTRKSGCVNVKGFGDTEVGRSRGRVLTTLYSRNNANSMEVELHIMTKLTGTLPTLKCQNGRWKHLEGLTLADPKWHQPGPIDILLGIRYFHKLMLTQRLTGPDDNAPVAWETVFGWVVAGNCPVEDGVPVNSFQITIDPIVEQLQKFWVVEEPPRKRILTREEKKCEEHFINTYKRDENGRFVVAVPFDEDKKKLLGRSRDIAYRRLTQVERRLKKAPQLQQQYLEFMEEYESLGHMSLVSQQEEGEQVGKTNYLCHHFVQNESSTTTKLRVVFDGSAATSSGISINETILVGATLQDDLYDMLLRFRKHTIVLKADIAKMFRQFQLREEDAMFHRILWRKSPEEPVKEYQLNTVTYGTACAPNLATRCIQQLGKDCSSTFPNAAKVLLEDTYIDDALFGKETEEEAIAVYHELNNAVATAGLQLRKWTSNSEAVMGVIPEVMREGNAVTFAENETVKALGVQWHPPSDVFKFKVIEFSNRERLSKRSLLSDIARLFDPLGLISCVTLRGKLLLQELWKLPVTWDDPIPDSIAKQWESYKEDLGYLTNLTIPRRITITGAERTELHGFSDSSELGFGGNLYLRSVFPNGSVEVKFVTSKTRVAPIRQVTLPRLELCAAVLLAELLVHVQECLKLDVEVFLWSDSTITLTWIAGSPRRWKTYIANRVATIQELTKIECWRHVSGVDNPADLASRGCTVQELCNSNFWWSGPQWLSQPVLPTFPKPNHNCDDLEERQVAVNVNQVDLVENKKLLRFSSLNRLKRTTAWYFRFLEFRLTKKCTIGPLTSVELQSALLFWIRKVQQLSFKDDIERLKKTKHVSSSSKLKALFPFIDQNGIARVSGRLRHANMEEQRKHQIILPGDSHLTKLLIDDCHHTNLHSGFQLTWATLQFQYWILRGREKVRHFVRSCVRCRRYRAKTAQQLMGDLPSPRVTPSRPFLHTGVDYAGPFTLKDNVGKVPKVYKGYLCLFVCLSTKAVHLEGVTSLSTEAFIASLRRFVSRRGLCAHLYSDCGSNFVGAERELKSFVEGEKMNEAVSRECSSRNITWHFNPPASPHHGGIWEAGVKSVKHHLRWVVGGAPSTFEQFCTVLTQIEAVLNSRPLYPMSAEPGDLEVLTPGHLLIGSALTAVPDHNWLDVPHNRLSQFQRMQQQLQHFWKRWSQDYLNTLQQRNKWMWEQGNVKQGDIVLLIEETPPGTWKLGRITEVRAGADGRVRVATVKTALSTFQRAITKLVPLVSEAEN